jgi:hypothetical protein
VSGTAVFALSPYEELNSLRFVASPSADCFLALISTVAPRSAHSLKNFMQNFLLSRASCNVYCNVSSSSYPTNCASLIG